MSNNNNIQSPYSETTDSNSETASSTSATESSLNSATKDVHAIKYKMSKAKARCMTYFRSLNSHLQVLSKEDLKGTRIEHGFKRAFMSLFDQDADTFTSTMLLNLDHLQKQLDKSEFQEDGSMIAFWGVYNQFQKFIDSQVTLDCDSQMTEKYFVEYTGIEVKHFRDTLLKHMGNVKKSIFERARHQRQYDRRVNKRLMQTQESTIDMGKAVHANLVVTESNGTELKVQVDNSRSGNYTDADDAVIKPIYDEEPMAKINYKSNLTKTNFKKMDPWQPFGLSIDSFRSSSIYSLLWIMTDKYFVEYTGIKYDRRVNKRQLQTQESKIHTGKEIDVDLVVIESSGTESEVQDDSNKSRNDTAADDADITQYMTKSQRLRSDLRWKPTGRIFKTIGLRLIPTRKILASCTSKDGSKPTHGSNIDTSNIHERKQTLDLSAGTSIIIQKEQSFDLSAGTSNNVSLVNVKEVPTADMISMTSMIELECLFDPSFDEHFNGKNQVVSKSSAGTTVDASDKRQQQPESTSSTSTLATTVTADVNFDM
nr:hypothetical protein [Tanacetum cinerariifolium]